MVPVVCRVRHDPPNSYGDCIRACVATIMGLDAEKVPHFAFDDPDGEVLNRRIRDFLAIHDLAPFWVHYDGNLPLETVLEMMGEMNPDAVYILYGSTGNGDHVVVCEGGKVVHNPAWYAESLKAPGSHGFWTILVLARV